MAKAMTTAYMGVTTPCICTLY